MPNGKPLYEPGKLIQSKAGGPKLVVDSVWDPDDHYGSKGKEPSYYCIWWVGNKRFREKFGESGLQPWVEPAKGT